MAARNPEKVVITGGARYKSAMADNTENPDTPACDEPTLLVTTSTGASNMIGSKDENHPARLDPTRYGDWEKSGRCIDF